MKKLILPLIIASSSLSAQTIMPVTGSGIGTVTNAMVNPTTGETGTAGFDFAPNGGSGTASAVSLFSSVGGAGTLLSFSRSQLGTVLGSSSLDITFDTAGEYTIGLLDFDITTVNSSIFTVSSGFTSFTTAAGANGTALGGSFAATQTSPTTFDLDVVDSGELAANSTNGLITLTYDVTAGQTLSFEYTDTNNGTQDALAFRVTQNEFVVAPVPEPSAPALLGLGALALLARRRR